MPTACFRFNAKETSRLPIATLKALSQLLLMLRMLRITDFPNAFHFIWYIVHVARWTLRSRLELREELRPIGIHGRQ